MKIINFQVELLGNREVIINGRPVPKGTAEVEEKVIFKTVTLDQQWNTLCELWKLLTKLTDVYNRSRVRAGEISMDMYDKGRIISAGQGIPGVVGALPRGKNTGKKL